MAKLYPLVLTLTLGAVEARACSYTCGPDAPVVRGDFTVIVKHAGAGLAGAGITIDAQGPGQSKGLSGVTNEEGVLAIRRLRPGTYWINANRLGVNAGFGCFRVARSPFVRRATIEIAWGEGAVEVQQLAGQLIGLRPDPARSPLAEYLKHRIERQPIVNAAVTLSSVTVGVVATVTSDESGHFTFPPQLVGTFVMRVAGGESGERYEATHLVVKVTAGASRQTLVLRRPVMGLCGSTQLEPI